MTFTLESPAFADGDLIPKRHTGEGQDSSPPLNWADAPSGTREFAVICDDPDAPSAEPWVHWVLCGLDAELEGLSEDDAGGGREGLNSWGTPGWRGPMPPPGHGIHHYRFRLLALDGPLDLPAGVAAADLLRAAEGHVLAEARLVGTFERR